VPTLQSKQIIPTKGSIHFVEYPWESFPSKGILMGVTHYTYNTVNGHKAEQNVEGHPGGRGKRGGRLTILIAVR